MKTMKIQSRYGEIRNIDLLDQDRGIFCMHGLSNFTRGGDGMFDFEGGPMLMVGEEFYGAGTISALSVFPPEGIESPKNKGATIFVFVDFDAVTLKRLSQGKEIFVSKKPRKNKKTIEEILMTMFVDEQQKGKS